MSFGAAAASVAPLARALALESERNTEKIRDRLDRGRPITDTRLAFFTLFYEKKFTLLAHLHLIINICLLNLRILYCSLNAYLSSAYISRFTGPIFLTTALFRIANIGFRDERDGNFSQFRSGTTIFSIIALHLIISNRH